MFLFILYCLFTWLRVYLFSFCLFVFCLLLVAFLLTSVVLFCCDCVELCLFALVCSVVLFGCLRLCVV